MHKVIISAKKVSGQDEIDLELSPQMTIDQILAEVARILEWDTRTTEYEVQIPGGRPLPGSKSLAELDMWDGTVLVFYPHYGFFMPGSQDKKTNPANLPTYLDGINPQK